MHQNCCTESCSLLHWACPSRVNGFVTSTSLSWAALKHCIPEQADPASKGKTPSVSDVSLTFYGCGFLVSKLPHGWFSIYLPECSSGIQDRRILCLLHRILWLNVACFLRELCSYIIILQLHKCICLLLQFLIKSLTIRWLRSGLNNNSLKHSNHWPLVSPSTCNITLGLV